MSEAPLLPHVLEPGAPKGVVAVFVGPDGREIASVAHFDTFRPGGFTVEEAQRYHAKRRIGRAVVDAMCSHAISESVDDYTVDRIIAGLMDRKGYKLHLIAVGHEGALS